MIDLPKFVLSKKSTATTYHFSVTTPRRCGWALATVNDDTGELLVTSDWGNWSHRWSANPSSLGAPSLTHFIALRDPYASNYLADKLCKRDEAQEFSPQKTVRWFGQYLAQARKDGDITREAHIELAETLAEMRNVDDVRDFVTLWQDTKHSEKVLEEPWEAFCHEPTGDYLVLRDAILPALIEACRDATAEKEAACG